MLRTIILDDEIPAVKLLTSFVKKVPYLQLELATTNAFEAIEYIQNHSVDLLLLDIEMPDISGIQLVKGLSDAPMIIFTTAYEKYALEGFELEVLDYLVKPIPFDRFLKAINKAQRFAAIPPKTVVPKNNYLLVKVDYQTVKIPFDDILYIEGLKDYVKIFTRQKMILTRLNVKGILPKLPAAQFIRVHRSYIVSFDKISTFQKSQISIGDQIIPLGNTYRANLLEKLK